MASGRVKRTTWAIYMDTSVDRTKALYNLVGFHTEDGTLSLNPASTDYSSIVEDVATSEIESYKPELPITTKVMPGNPVFEFVYSMKRDLATLDDVKTSVLLVDIWDNNRTEQYDVAIQVDSYGGKALESLGFSYTIKYNGAPVIGVATIDTVAKTATFVSTALATLKHTTADPSKAYMVVSPSRVHYYVGDSVTVTIKASTGNDIATCAYTNGGGASVPVTPVNGEATFTVTLTGNLVVTSTTEVEA